jgi:sec-independent protein translocase protein TatA
VRESYSCCIHFDNPINIVILLVIALLILGPKRLPEAGRGLGRGLREFKDSLTGVSTPETPEPPQVPAGESKPQPPAH